jgi:hypothetical protein
VRRAARAGVYPTLTCCPPPKQTHWHAHTRRLVSYIYPSRNQELLEKLKAKKATVIGASPSVCDGRGGGGGLVGGVGGGGGGGGGGGRGWCTQHMQGSQ